MGVGRIMGVNTILGCLLVILSDVVFLGGALKFSVEPQSAVVRPCSSVILTCSAYSADQNQRVTIQWIVNGTVQATRTSSPSNGRLHAEGGTLRIASPCASSGHVTGQVTTGIYQCLASSPLEGAVVSVEAHVEQAYLRAFDFTPIPTESHNVVEVKVVEGSSAILPCFQRVESLPSASIIFERVNGTIASSTTSSIAPGRHIVLPSGRLLIADVREIHDAGFYRCSAYNALLNSSVVSSTTYKLTVIAVSTTSSTGLAFLWTSSDSVTAEHGNNLTLECVAHGVPKPTVTWSKYGGQLPVDRHHLILGNLVIEHVDRFDAGTYLCKASNGKVITKVISVHVSEPPEIETGPSDQVAAEGATVVFRCRALGSPTISTQWLFNGNSINSGGQLVTIKETTLTLSSVNRRQAGIYQCVVRNGYGTDYAVARLTISDRSTTQSTPATPTEYSSYTEDAVYEDPDSDYEDLSSPSGGSANQKPTLKSPGKGSSQLMAPSRPRVTPLSDTSVRVQWDIASTGSSLSMLAFKVQYRVVEMNSKSIPFLLYHWQTVDNDVMPTTYSFDILGLPTGVTYRFRVVAIYAGGESRHGPTSSRVTVGISSESSSTSHLSDSAHLAGRVESSLRGPIIVEVRSLSNSEMFVGWQYQDDVRWPADGFYIEYAPLYADRVEYRLRHLVLGPLARHAILSRLVPSTTYSIRMQSYSGSGQFNVRSSYGNVVVKETLAAAGEQDFPGSNRSKSRSSRPPTEIATGRTPRSLGDGTISPTVRGGPSSHPHGGHGAGNLSPDNRTLFIVLGVTVGIVAVVLTMSAVVCFKKHTGSGRHWWYFEATKEQGRRADVTRGHRFDKENYHGVSHVSRPSAIVFDVPVEHRVCSATNKVTHQLHLSKPDVVSCKHDEKPLPAIPTTPSAFHRPVTYSNQAAFAVRQHQVPVQPVAVKPTVVTTDAQTPVYMHLMASSGRNEGDSSTVSSGIEVGGRHQLTRWINSDDLKMSTVGSSSSETMTTSPPPPRCRPGGHRAKSTRLPLDSTPTRHHRKHHVTRPGVPGGGGLGGESDVDGDASPMTSHHSASRISTDSVNSIGSTSESAAMTSCDAAFSGGDLYRTRCDSSGMGKVKAEQHHPGSLADRVLGGAYQIQRHS